jgi:anion-transporting  ArsA/GET3 family ATPase
MKKKTKVYICVGSGGVGKTCLASALGYKAAELGFKTLVLTIDPAARLKTTLGISNLESQIKDPDLKAEFWAGIIDPKKTFDDFVSRASEKSEAVAKLLRNKLYQQLSGGLSGSQEFTAMERLYAAYETGQYDIIILDTPPTKHAMDFLIAPQKISNLFQEAIAKWLRGPTKSSGFIFNFVQFGTKKVLKILELLTGSEFIQNLNDFFESIQDWQGSLDQRTKAVHQLLIDSETHFVLITGFDRAKLLEAQFFDRELKKGGYHLKSFFINRAYPEWLNFAEFENIFAKNPQEEKLLCWVKHYKERLTLYKSFFGDGKNLSDRNINVNYIPELQDDIFDLQGVKKLAGFVGPLF